MDINTFEEITSPNFDGRFYFTNPTKEDFIVLWNNKEYNFPAQKTVAIIIPTATLEEVQEIRKKFAYKLAQREFYKGKEYKRLSKMGSGLPPTFDEKEFEPMIEECLKPMPLDQLKVRKAPKKDIDDDKFKATMAIADGDDPNFAFREKVNANSVRRYGKMSDK